MHAFNPSTWEAEASGSLVSSMLICFTKWVPGQPSYTMRPCIEKPTKTLTLCICMRAWEYACAPLARYMPVKVRRGIGWPKTGVRHLWVIMWMLGSKLVSSARTTRALKTERVIFPAPRDAVPFKYFYFHLIGSVEQKPQIWRTNYTYPKNLNESAAPRIKGVRHHRLATFVFCNHIYREEILLCVLMWKYP